MIETLSSIEPLLFEEEVPRRLADLATQIQQEVARLERGLPADALRDIAEVVRHADGSCSNLIRECVTGAEPSGNGSDAAAPDAVRRPSTAEVDAEAAVLRAIHRAHAAGTLVSPTSIAFLAWAHRAFYDALGDPEPGRAAEGREPGTRGRLREAPEDGGGPDRVPQAGHRVGAFLAHFERRFRAAERWPSAGIIAVAAAHHRLNLIRPFPYGNGRVNRMMSHAMVLRAGIGCGGLWSISRGLARAHGDYHRMMRHAGRRRIGDGDGRGQLSATALREFSEWMLSVMLEEIRFARASFGLETLELRYRTLLRRLDHDDNAQELAALVLRFGQIDRGDACVVLKTSERTARSALSRLVHGGFLKSATPKGPVRIAFPVEHRDQLFPQLFAGLSAEPFSLPATSLGPMEAWAPPRHPDLCDRGVRDKGVPPW